MLKQPSFLCHDRHCSGWDDASQLKINQSEAAQVGWQLVPNKTHPTGGGGPAILRPQVAGVWSLLQSLTVKRMLT
jgi:hypothetical protein